MPAQSKHSPCSGLPNWVNCSLRTAPQSCLASQLSVLPNAPVSQSSAKLHHASKQPVFLCPALCLWHCLVMMRTEVQRLVRSYPEVDVWQLCCWFVPSPWLTVLVWWQLYLSGPLMTLTTRPEVEPVIFRGCQKHSYLKSQKENYIVNNHFPPVCPGEINGNKI